MKFSNKSQFIRVRWRNMKESYRLDGKELPVIPTPPDCVVKEVWLEGRNLVFAFEDDISVHDAICVQERGAKSLIMTFHLLSDAYDIMLLQWKKSPVSRLFHRPGVYKEIDIQNNPERLTALASGSPEYLCHNVGYCSIIVKLWSRGGIIMDIAADRVELDWVCS